MMAIDLERKKRNEAYIKQQDEDDYDSLPVIDQKAIRHVVTQFETGRFVESFTPQKIGAYKKDLIKAVFKHVSANQEQSINFVEQLLQCTHDLPKILQRESEVVLQKCINELLNGNETYDDQVKLLEKHIIFCINLKNIGLDSRNKIIQQLIIEFSKLLKQFVKNANLMSTNQVSMQLYQQQFPFNMVNFLKTIEQLLEVLLSSLFGFEEIENMILCELSKEQVFQLINGAQFSMKIQQDDVELAKIFFSSVNKFIQGSYVAFQQINSNILQQTKKQKCLDEQAKKCLKDLIKYNSFVIQQLNQILEFFKFNKQISFIKILTQEEEMMLVDLYGEIQSNVYRVYSFNKTNIKEIKSCPLMASSACMVQLEFQFPTNLFRVYEQQLTQLKIKKHISLLGQINLMKNLQNVLNCCSNLDDVEYVAYSIYQQNKYDIQYLKYKLSTKIKKPWYFKNIQFIAHFIACFYYNGIQLYGVFDNQIYEKQKFYELVDLGKIQWLNTTTALYNKPQINEIQLLCQFIGKLLFYRLISTLKIQNLLYYCQQKMQEHNPIIQQNDIFIKNSQFFIYLIVNCQQTINLLDEYFFDNIERQHNIVISTCKQLTFINKGQAQIMNQQISNVITVFGELKENKQHVLNLQTDYENKLKLQEKVRKDEEWMKRLKKMHPQLYEQELKKRKRIEQEQCEKRVKDENEREAKRQLKEERRKKNFNDVINYFNELVILGDKSDQIDKKCQEFNGMYSIITNALTKKYMDENQIESSSQKSIKEAKQDEYFKQLIQIIESSVKMSTVKIYARIMWNIYQDIQQSKKLKKMQYCENLICNYELSIEILTQKFMMFLAIYLDSEKKQKPKENKYITKEHMLHTCNQLLQSIKFVNKSQINADLSDLHKQIILNFKISLSNQQNIESYLWKLQFLLNVCVYLDDKQLQATCIIIYGLLNDNQFTCVDNYLNLLDTIKIEQDDATSLMKFLQDNFDASNLKIVQDNLNKITHYQNNKYVQLNVSEQIKIRQKQIEDDEMDFEDLINL